MIIKLEVTEQQEHFLRQFAERQTPGSDDNVGTNKPLHLVQTKETRIIWDGGMSGDTVFVCTDTEDIEAYETPEALVVALSGRTDIVSYEEAYRNGISEDHEMIADEEDYFEAYGLEDCYKVSRVYEWRTVSIHFTLAEAKRYKEYQKHNLTNPRTYTVSGGYSNEGDYEPVWDFIMAAGQAVIAGGDIVEKAPPSFNDGRMHLYTAPGEKVVFLDDGGTQHDRDVAQKYLAEGDEYTVEKLSVDRWNSQLYLKEFPGVSFNTVMFANVNDNPVTVAVEEYNTCHW